MVTLNTIRTRLQEVIKSSGIKQADICRQLNIKSSTMSQYLSGRAMPALDTFANLCIILDVEPSYILGIADFGGGRVVAKNYVHLSTTTEKLT